MRLILGAIMALIGVGALVLAFAPGARMGPLPSPDDIQLGENLPAFLASEKSLDDIVPGTEARIVWAGERGEATDWAVVYLHGFSASSEEIRPVPDRVAEALGANLFYAQFTGHARDSEDMLLGSADAWGRDTAEAIAIGERIGERVLVIATSNGGALAAIAAADPATSGRADAFVLVSPNFGPRVERARFLTWPGASIWVPWVAGRTHGFEPANPAHAEYWTERYPTVALIPTQAVVERAKAADLGAVTAPALFIYSPEDKVVRPDAIRDAIAEWGGSVNTMEIAPGEGIDPSNHVVTGDILSPATTDPVVQRITEWAQTLPIQ